MAFQGNKGGAVVFVDDEIVGDELNPTVARTAVVINDGEQCVALAAERGATGIRKQAEVDGGITVSNGVVAVWLRSW